VVVVVAVGKDDDLLFGCCVGTAAGPEAGAKGLGSGPDLTVTLPGACWPCPALDVLVLDFFLWDGGKVWEYVCVGGDRGSRDGGSRSTTGSDVGSEARRLRVEVVEGGAKGC
jgi:hypothetical protein